MEETMIIRRKPDESLIRVLAGNRANSGLNEMKVRLALIQAAGTMALEGTTRATASQVAFRAAADYKVNVTASVAGQTLAAFNIDSRMTHGKSKFVLDADKLEKIRVDVVSQVESAMAKLTAAIEQFQDLPQRIDRLQERWQETLAMRAREQELIKLIKEDAVNPSRIEYLEAEYNKIRKPNEGRNQ
jgi:hypothetical protein